VATLQDIADELGLSRATVSRALNDFPEVSDKTKQKVRAAAKRLGYRPNLHARKLITGRSGIVALLVQEEKNSLLDLSTDSFLGRLTHELTRHNLDLVVRLIAPGERTDPYKRFATRNFVDCIIINAPHVDDYRIEALEEVGAKFVVHGRDIRHQGYAYYDIDNFGGARQAADYLCDLGHERLAILLSDTNLAFASSRLDGFKTAIEKRTHCNCELLIDDHQSDFSYTVAKRALSRKDRPTAIYCGNGLFQAIGVYRAARELGLAIPDDLSVIAHDDAISQGQTEEFSPPLTVTRRPINDACLHLARMVIDLIEDNSAAQMQRVDSVELIVRGSTTRKL